VCLGFTIGLGTEGVGQVVVSLLISVLMLGHKAGTVNGIINSVNRRKEIEEVLEQLERSKSQREFPPDLVKHARRLTLLDGDDDIVQVAWACVPGAYAAVGCGPVDACVCLSHRLAIGHAWATMAGSGCAKDEHRSQPKPTATCGRADPWCGDAEPSRTQLCKSESPQRAMNMLKWLIWLGHSAAGFPAVFLSRGC
jgi:hypothetical protein